MITRVATVQMRICRFLVFILLFLPSHPYPSVACPPVSFQQATHPLLKKAEGAFAERHYDEAILFSSQLLKLTGEGASDELKINAYHIMGASYVKKRSFDDALAAFNKALVIGETMTENQTALQAETYFHLGDYYDRTGNAEKSIENHQKALDLRRKVFGPIHKKVAESLNGIGEVYLFTVRDYKKANSHFEKAAAIFDRTLGPDDFNRYLNYFNLARTNRNLGNHDKALAYAFKAFAVIESNTQHHASLDKCYSLLGDIYYSKTEYNKAIQYFKKGIETGIATRGPDNFDLINKYTNIGVACVLDGDHNGGIGYFRKALNVAQHHAHAGEFTSNNYRFLGWAFQKAGNFDSARFYLNKGLSVHLATYGNKSSRTGETYMFLAKLFQQFGKPDSALVYIQRSFQASIKTFNNTDNADQPTFAQVGERYELFTAFAAKGSILLDLYLKKPANVQILESALRSYKIADHLMELNRKNYQLDDPKLFFADHYHSIYEKALAVCYRLHQETKEPKYAEDALMFMEKNRALLLAESLHKAEVFTRAGLPDSLRLLERNIYSELSHYKSELAKLEESAAAEETMRKTRTTIFELSQQQEKLNRALETQYPNYFRTKYQPLTRLESVQHFASNADAMVISYFWAEQEVYMLAMTGSEVVFKMSSQADSLERTILNYFQEIQPNVSQYNNQKSFESFFNMGRKLYHTLLSPLLQEAKSVKKLIIIRDGPLLLIPFESLPVSDDRSGEKDFQSIDYLIRHHITSYAHSANLLVSPPPQTSRVREGSVLGFSFSGAEQLQKTQTSATPLTELPGAARELAAISDLFPGEFFQGADATENKFKTLAPDFDILHLAVHGKSDPDKQLSGSLFFKNSADSLDDGELHSYEVYDLNVRARLAVLTACESGVGKFFKGEGVYSIARSFDYAGCPSTVITLWAVSDKASAQIMTSFYRELKNGNEINEALHNAKLSYITSVHSQLTHPSYWAAFVLTGKTNPVANSPMSLALVLIITVCIAVALILYFYLKKKRRPVKNDRSKSAIAS